MKGILLAGGTGTRLFPLTKVTNKHLLPIGKKPMIFYPLEQLLGCGIQDIMIVTGTEHMGDVISLLGSGKEFKARFTYKVQDEAGGIAQALGLAEDFIHDEKMIALLGDNIFGESLRPYANQFREQSLGVRLMLKEVDDPERFGVAEVQGKNILSIEEKPKNPKSNLAVTGCYMYGPEVFSIIKSLKPSGRGELEITDVNNEYVRRGKAEFNLLLSWWSDAGTFESLRRVNELIEQTGSKLSSSETSPQPPPL
jgi:glucose-1-phosphate thymidylyltransferase